MKNDHVFFIRVEQLYPFPVKTLSQTLKDLKKLVFIGVKKNLKIWELGTQLEIILSGL